jgi:predicted molibdopterin-dependent oxidoreductase YjgC
MDDILVFNGTFRNTEAFRQRLQTMNRPVLVFSSRPDYWLIQIVRPTQTSLRYKTCKEADINRVREHFPSLRHVSKKKRFAFDVIDQTMLVLMAEEV